jgi:hypothetical protein
MSIGYWLFLATSALATSASWAYVQYLHRAYGHGSYAARDAAIVLAVSLAAYMVPCVLLGYGVLDQLPGLALSGGVLWAGRRWIPDLAPDRLPEGTEWDAPPGGTDA